jgi:hypothetical protein
MSDVSKLKEALVQQASLTHKWHDRYRRIRVTLVFVAAACIALLLLYAAEARADDLRYWNGVDWLGWWWRR